MTLNHHLAVKVMGWTVMQPSGVIVFANNQRSGMKLPDFDPSENIEQAMMCLGNAAHWRMEWAGGDYFIAVELLQDWGELKVEHESLPMAISLACAKATGWEE